MRDPTGAIARTVSAADRAMTTAPEGTFCAPTAPRTICSTVEIFTNEVSVMNTNGRSDTSASATTSASGRLKSSSTDAPPIGTAARCGGAAPHAIRFEIQKATANEITLGHRTGRDALTRFAFGLMGRPRRSLSTVLRCPSTTNHLGRGERASRELRRTWEPLRQALPAERLPHRAHPVG